MRKLTERYFSSDFVRFLCIIFMIAGHALNYNGSMEHTIGQYPMFWWIVLKTVLMFSATTLIISTGYLMGERLPNKRHYIKIIKIIIIYVMTAIIVFIFEKYYFGVDRNFLKIFTDIFAFEGMSYAWFLKMYICLYLVIPFINILYKKLDKKQKKFLILILMYITVIPIFFSEISFVIGRDLKIPDFFIEIYPIMLYLMGLYIKEYDLKMKVPVSLALIAATIMLISISDYYEFYGISPHYFAGFISFRAMSFQNIILSLLIFIAIKDINFNKWNTSFKKFISYLSKHTLGVMTLSYPIEIIVYEKIIGLENYKESIGFYVLGVLLVVIITNILVIPIYELYDKTFKKLIDKFNIKDINPSEKEKNKNY